MQYIAYLSLKWILIYESPWLGILVAGTSKLQQKSNEASETSSMKKHWSVTSRRMDARIDISEGWNSEVDKEWLSNFDFFLEYM